MIRTPLRLTSALALLLAACSDGTTILPSADAAEGVDTSVADAAAGDALIADTETPASDAGLADASAAPDADPAPDVGFAPDAAPPPDAGFADAATPDAGEPAARFSFFVTSIEAMRMLSGSQDGFGGALTYGGQTGLAGADAICAAAAELGMPGAGAKTWRAFLSASTGGANGGPVHAIERVGTGPWYDRNGRLVAQNVAGLTRTRPQADALIANDLPNERGESQRNQPGANGQGTADNHDILTGSDASGRFVGGSASVTCNDWTSRASGVGRPMAGHSWPAQSGQSWIRAHTVAGCPAVVNLVQNGPGSRNCEGVGCGGGYGALYCFALEP